MARNLRRDLFLREYGRQGWQDSGKVLRTLYGNPDRPRDGRQGRKSGIPLGSTSVYDVIKLFQIILHFSLMFQIFSFTLCHKIKVPMKIVLFFKYALFFFCFRAAGMPSLPCPVAEPLCTHGI